MFEQMLSQVEMDRWCQPCGVIERQRKLTLEMVVRAMVMAAGAPGGAYQADGLRAAFYRWCEVPREQCMAALAERALACARAQQVDLPGPLSGGKDWSIVDSTTVMVRAALFDDFPGTGDDAAIKVHQVLSVGCGAPVRYHFSPAREPVTPECFPGTDLDTLLEDEPRVLKGWAIDADVHGGGGTHPLPRRLGGFQTPQGYDFFLTHLRPRVSPLQVVDLYRVRWERALSLKLDKSVNRLDAIDTERPCSLKTMLHASLMASAIAAIRAHSHHLNTCPQPVGAPRTEAPLHTRLLALPLAVSCQSIAQAFALKGAEAQRRWAKIAELLTHSGKDPHWRRWPSVLGQLRGWKRPPIARDQHSNHRLQMAA